MTAKRALIALSPELAHGAQALFPLEDIMAIEESAFGRLFAGPDGDPRALSPGEDSEHSTVAVINIEGPLVQRASWFADGYDTIAASFASAARSSARAIVLRINSPGGVCTGLFQTTEGMRELARAAGKKVFAYADEHAYSAAYALASVADEIYLPPSGGVGSVGVLAVVMEASKLLDRVGVRAHVLKSGVRKAEGNFFEPLSEEALERFQARVDYLANIFFEHVAASRGLTTAAVKKLQAGVLLGPEAVKAGLADGVVLSFDAFLNHVHKSVQASQSGQGKVMNRENTGAASSGVLGAELVSSAPGLASIAVALGLTSDAAESTVLQRGMQLRETERTLLKLTEKPTMDEALGAVQGFKLAHARALELEQQLAATRKVEQAREIDGLIERGKAEGKITNAELEAEMRAIGGESPARLKSLLGTMPRMVGTTRHAEVVPERHSKTLTAEELAVAKQLGLTAEQMAASASAEEGN